MDHNPSLECDDHGAIVDRILQITSIVHCVLVLAVFFFLSMTIQKQHTTRFGSSAVT